MSVIIRRLIQQSDDFKTQLDTLLAFDQAHDQQVNEVVTDIIQQVKTHGDQAVLSLTNQLDRVNAQSLSDLEINQIQLNDALASITPEIKQALQRAAQRIRYFHEKQQQNDWRFTDELGNVLGQQVKPMARVGIYVPGGKAVYPSSVLMNAIPAKVAGVPEIIMVVPTPNGTINSLILAAAVIAGVDRIFTIGGAQAIAALAYGTESIPQVDKIVGPGNIYVATAKRMVFGQVGIDMIAGPSEILVVCDGSTNPDWIAMDLFSQAEHDEDAQAILISTSAKFLDAVQNSIDRLLPKQPRAEVIAASLSKRGAFILSDSINSAIDLVNEIAPEHLELSFTNAEHYIEKIHHAGAIFVGKYTAEAFGDYCAGPNHVLPTSRTARFSSPLGVYDFQKRSSIIQLSSQGAADLAQTVTTLAEGELLAAHAQSAAYRKYE